MLTAATLNLAHGDTVWDLKQLGLLGEQRADMSRLDGQHASLLGFVYRTDRLPTDQFLVGRFAVRCCTADAIAFIFPVRYASALELERDTWVQVDGTIQTQGASPVLQADVVRLVDTPDRPYLQLP
jgi:uncharacterized repeat protein (TIGR03943 family)